ncbi:9998_t:CDS:2, partial [Scutellospora calospora]
SQLKLTGGSISNLISHLSNIHSITKDGPKLSEHDHSKQTKIDSFVATITTYQHNKSKNNKLIMALIKFIICDAQPFNLVSSQFFCEFVKELDPMFILPSKKRIKQTIYMLYNQCAGSMQEKLQNSVITCSLTTDLWTARNKQGYLGVTCSWIDPEFKIHEILLSLTYVKYPHTADTIQEKLEDIISDWGLTEKERLLLIKDAINIVLTTLTVFTASEARPFYETTKELGGSEYVTISYMFPSILALMQKLASSTSSYDEELDDEINFEMDDLAFNEDLRFATISQRREAEAALRTKYNNAKSLYQSSTTLSTKSFSPNEDQNNQGSQVYQKSFLKTVFIQDISNESNDEVDNYLSLFEIFYKSNPFDWWNSQKAFFPIIMIGELQGKLDNPKNVKET